MEERKRRDEIESGKEREGDRVSLPSHILDHSRYEKKSPKKERPNSFVIQIHISNE